MLPMPEFSDASPRLGLPYLQPAQAQKHVTHNAALQRLDALAQLSLASTGAETPPAAPEPGEIHALGAAPQGDWAGQAGQLALWDGGAWLFVTPRPGWRAHDLASGRGLVFAAGGWQPEIAALADLEGLGIKTGWDAVNRLSVSAEASLFSHDAAGGGHQIKVNKAAAGETASLLFQSGWTGHAEMGLAGDTAFALKTSADGGTWYEALRLDPATAEMRLAPGGTLLARLAPGGFEIDVPLGGSAVQADALDAGAGRVMTTGAFGLGARDAEAVVIADGHADLPSGFYAGGGAAAVNFPGGAAEYAFVNATRRMGPGSYRQTRLFLDAGAITLRSSEDGGATWSEDLVFYSRANLLGAVSQAAGLPTGAVVERGANANGDYMRFADGTQICTLSRSPSLTTSAHGPLHRAQSDFGPWTFPAAFAAPPAVQGNIESANEWVSCGFANASGITGVIVFAVNPLVAVTRTLRVTAIGRWF
jgi:hypothetical protein